MPFSRRKFLAACAGVPAVGLASLCYMRWAEPTWYEITTKYADIGKLDVPLRVLHLSDFHASEDVSYDYIETVVDAALQGDCDMALLTGDFITWKLSEIERYSTILAKISAQVPTFACVGNHDGGRWAGSSLGYPNLEMVSALLAKASIHLLFNQSQKIEIKHQAIEVVGLGDLWAGDVRPESALSRKRGNDQPIFVLSHNPDSKSLIEEFDWDIMFSGHTHGGQLVIPLLGKRPFLPIVDKGFAEGLLPYSKRLIHVTRGVGNLHGLRFNCRPEVSFLQIK